MITPRAFSCEVRGRGGGGVLARLIYPGLAGSGTPERGWLAGTMVGPPHRIYTATCETALGLPVPGVCPLSIRHRLMFAPNKQTIFIAVLRNVLPMMYRDVYNDESAAFGRISDVYKDESAASGRATDVYKDESAGFGRTLDVYKDETAASGLTPDVYKDESAASG